MSESNPLVAEEAGRDPLAGTFALYDGVHLVEDLGNGSWLAASLDGLAFGFDVAATVSDPIGSLLAAGLGWLMDHLEPIKGWLDDLTGNAELVKSYGETWENVAGKLEQTAATLRSNLESDLAGMSGDAVEAYRKFGEELVETLENTAKTASSTSSGLVAMGTVVDAVHGIVRDTLAIVVADLITYAAELVCTLGLATPLVIEQATTRISSAVAEVSDKIHGIVESVEALKNLLSKVDTMINDVRNAADKIHPDLLGHRPEHRAEPSVPRHRAEPGESTPSTSAHEPGSGGRHEREEPPGTHEKSPEEQLKEKLKEDVSPKELGKTTVAEGAAAGATTSREHAE